MSMVALPQRIASAFVVHVGKYGDVTRAAQERGVCRQSIYREAKLVVVHLEGKAHREEVASLRQRVQELEQALAKLQERMAHSVILDKEKQKEFASVGQGIGVSLPALRVLLQVLLSGKAPSVAKLGRWTQAIGKHCGLLLKVLDKYTRPRVRQAVPDEMFVSQPVLMVVEPESLCWVTGRKLDGPVTGAAWTEEFGKLRALEQVTRDAGVCLGRGLADLNAKRLARGRKAIPDQLDHFHVLREGSCSAGRMERAARRAFTKLEEAEAKLAECQRQGERSSSGCQSRLRACRRKAELAMDLWGQRERTWRQVKGALQPFTPQGELNTRAKAEAVLAKTLPELPDKEFGKFKRLVRRPETLTYLDEIQRKLGELPLPSEVVKAAVRHEGLQRRPELLQRETPKAGALRGVLVACAVVLAQVGDVGHRAVEAVRAILRKSWRASSLVECVNGVVRMQQARHRKMSQGLIDLKRLYWNCHILRTGRRRGKSPYQRLGVVLPEGLHWWDMLKWSPEQLKEKLSALNMPP